MDTLQLQLFRENLLGNSRHSDSLRLTHHGYKVYSQNDEDGILAEIFRRIDVKDRSFVEFGVEAGVECNSMWLLMQGWSGLWIEGSADHCAQIQLSHQSWIDQGKLTLLNAMVTAENINGLIGQKYAKQEVDLLSIDLDSIDYWVWQAIDTINPRVVAVEYNATWAPPAALTVPYEAGRRWNGTNHFGASLSALNRLAVAKGYDLVGCCLAGVNAFFVRKDLTGDAFISPGSVEEHYEPARYALSALPAGHPTGILPVVIVD